MRITLKRGNDQIITLSGLRIMHTAEYLNAATVIGNILDVKGKPVPSLSNATMTYVPDSNGEYEWKVAGQATMIPPNKSYLLVVTAAQESMHYRTTCPVTVED